MEYNMYHKSGVSIMLTSRLPKDYPWEVFGRLLADLRDSLTEAEYQELSSILRLRDYDGYLELSERWSLQCLASAGGAYHPDWVAKYQLSRLLYKYQFQSDSSQRVSTAMKKFKAADFACREFNRSRGKFLRDRLEQTGFREVHSLHGLPMDRLRDNDVNVLVRARHFIALVLGESLPEFDKLSIDARHGPGSTLATVDGQVSTYYKYSQWPYTVTSRCAHLARRMIMQDPRWLGALEDSYRRRFNIPAWRILDWDLFWSRVFDIVNHNRVCFVPKDGRTDRPIAIEPTLNLMLQLGVDGFIRKRLKRWGIDLDDQSKNQHLARSGSIANEHGFTPYSTIDLASASDSVSLRLCQILLPREWWQYLFDLRSPRGHLPNGEIVRYSKISSMGNGYTFALESLIFAALCYGVAKTSWEYFPKTKIAVYGDDIIVPEQIAQETLHWLGWFGFTVNVQKSFLFGTVKESCGTDWVQGRLVRPVHMRHYPRHLADVMTDRNRLARWLELRMGIPLEESQLVAWFDKYLEAMPRGPLSDESFSSYVHTRVRGKYKRYLYRWPTLVQVPKRQWGDEFFFRKLMHPLKAHPAISGRPLSPDWLPDGREESGDSFIIHKRNALWWTKARSVASYWQHEYVDRDYRSVTET